jgi:caffeoyl-CoA O-methyltransferase
VIRFPSGVAHSTASRCCSWSRDLPGREKMKRNVYAHILFAVLGMTFLLPAELMSQGPGKKRDLDEKVRTFLEKRQGAWRDLNIPASDGKILYDLIIKNNYKRALEIGTSTGHSTIFIAWALSKTGGKVITIEIDKERYRQALANFKEAGLSAYIDARLADAHLLVKELPGPFDFVFCDADKEWYKNYFLDVYPKIEAGGCYTAHNVSARSWGMEGAKEFYDYIKNVPTMKTMVDESGGGISISYKQ